jgi:hypothetical protein
LIGLNVILNSCLVSVVATNRLILWRSEIFGGISNDISVLLDQSTLREQMEGTEFGSKSNYFSSSFCFAARGYLAKLKDDPKAIICLGDSAYHKSSVKDELGIGRPVPLPKDGVQQKV